MRTFLKGLAWTLPGLLLFYCWLGFLAVPSLGLFFGNQLLERYTTQPSSLQRLEFNPLSLELRLWQLNIGEQPAIALAEARTRLDWGQLFAGRIHLKDTLLQQPAVDIELDESGQLTLLQLFDLPPSEDQPEQESSAPFPLTLEQVHLVQGTLQYRDNSLQQPVAVNFDPLNAELHSFSLDQPAPATFNLQLEAGDGTQLQADGNFALQELTSEGRLQADGIELTSWWPYVTEQLPLHLQQGTLQLDSHYRLEIQPEFQMLASNLNLQLDSLHLTDAEQNLLLETALLHIKQGNMDLAAQQISVEHILLQGINAPLLIDEQGQLNWAKIAPPDSGSTETAAADTANSAAKPFAMADIPWHLLLNQLDIADSRIAVELRNQPEPAKLEFQAVSLQLESLDSRGDDPFKLALATQLGEQGQIDLAATLAPQTLAAHADLKTRNIDLRVARPWIKPYVRIELLSAFLDADLKAAFATLNQPDLDLSGAVDIRQMHVRDLRQNRDLLKWKNLQLQDLAFKQTAGNSDLRLGRIHLHEPYARLIINENLETNISELIIPQPDSPPASDSQPSNFAFELGQIQLDNGSTNFADFSLQPHFAIAVQKLNGYIGTLDSNSTQPTPVKISGAVDNYAPVTIEGSLTPFDPMQQLDIATEFKNVELTALTPYSGKFAGYRIQKGRLNMELHYQVNQGQLSASNSVLLEQLQLGEKVESPDAVDLPVRLALAMLKDTKGNIDIQLPVKGDLNNPEFSVMPIVWQTLRNLLTRAVTSPFKMLASIGAAGDRDLSQIPFAPGSAALAGEAITALDSLAVAMQQRPMLKLNIEGTSSGAADGPALAGLVLERRYQEMLHRQLQERGKPLPDDIYSLDVPERSRDDLLEELYQSMLAEGKVDPTPDLPRKERQPWKQEQVLSQLSSDPLYLRWLAQQRAANIREHLIEQGGVAVERLYLLDVNERVEAADGHVSSQLHVDVL